jgi:hypothetical protein
MATNNRLIAKCKSRKWNPKTWCTLQNLDPELKNPLYSWNQNLKIESQLNATIVLIISLKEMQTG